MIERIKSSGRLSQAVRHNGIMYLTGQVGDGHTIEEQTRDCLARIDALLAEAGSDRNHILSATIWMANMADFAGMNSVWDAWVNKDQAPARATCEARLARPHYKVEIVVTAAMPG